MRALLAKREDSLSNSGNTRTSKEWLAAAQIVRLEALKPVRGQESLYRYPVALIARERASLTAYPFGYLYPAGVLFFWEREEEQIRQERFDAFFMNLWDFRRTLGLGSLFFKN